jgi:hypothetical protein
MSDRTRGAVRTGSREGAGVPEATTGIPADDGRPAPAGGTTPAGQAAAKPAGVAMAKSAGPAATSAGPTQTTVAGGAVAAGAARPDAPDDATARVTGTPSRPAEAGDGAPVATGVAAGGPTAVPATGGTAQRPAKATADKARTSAGRNRGPRRARLQLRHVDTWSALKISLVVSIALFFVWMVAVGILFGVLNGLGVFDTLNDLFGQLGSVSGGEVGPQGGSEVISAGVVFGGAAVIGLINIVLMTALCTVGAVVYNLCSDLVGGVEVTLSERD